MNCTVISEHLSRFLSYLCAVELNSLVLGVLWILWGQIDRVLFAICTADKKSRQLCRAIWWHLLMQQKLIRTNEESTQSTSKRFDTYKHRN